MVFEDAIRFYAAESRSRDEILGKLISNLGIELDSVLQNIHVHKYDYNNYVLVDLGNIHNLLKEIDNVLPYTIYAFADKCFNGYGVNPRASNAVRVIRALEGTKNAADIHIIWIVAKICFTSKVPCNIHVVTKDKGFLELQNLARTFKHHLFFHSSKEEFYSFIQFSPPSTSSPPRGEK